MSESKAKEQPVSQVAQAQKFGEFKKLPTNTNANWHALEKGANHLNSMKLLEEAALRPLTYKEALTTLMNDYKLKKTLKGKWFYLDGKGLSQDGLYTINKEGDLVRSKGPTIEKTVRVWKGSHPLSLNVYSDDYAAGLSGRFFLNANNEPDYVSRVVVGKPKLEHAEPHTPKLLRLDEGERLEVTLRDGQKVVLDAIEAITRKE